MKSDVNRCWRLAARPVGMIKDSDFTFHEEPIPELRADGEVLVRTSYLSVDPTQRGFLEWLVPIGGVVQSMGAGRVVQSRDPNFAVGDLVQGAVGWQDYAVSTGEGPTAATKLLPGVPLPRALGALGLTGLTAYFGLLEVGRPRDGETVVVSGAAGATGMLVGQIAKLKGCRAVGIAGGPEKCAWLTRELGFDAAIDYRSEDVAERLRALCPQGINIYFDNVGGKILEAAIGQIASKGRVVLCGGISGYNDLQSVTGPKNYLNLIVQSVRMEGFVVTEFAARFPEALAELAGWLSAGKIKDQVDIVEGLENAPAALRRLFTGANKGKQLLKVAEI
ncbi:NADP-dependent oxidoreductase [Sorangium cellulosum]|uniref:NADP-dependent oxidoreductase n=1 Tax=Sorangium cellulosum TaxID=56 RepID=A0A4V0NEN9_SORCE|nr:NADP-dependent oxidoreductase [Sorangium cellulosum]